MNAYPVKWIKSLWRRHVACQHETIRFYYDPMSQTITITCRCCGSQGKATEEDILNWKWGKPGGS